MRCNRSWSTEGRVTKLHQVYNSRYYYFSPTGV